MYAIIETGGKQYRVEEGDILNVELLGEKKEVEFPILFLDGKTGTPHLTATVKAEVVGEIKGLKSISYKYKKRKCYRRKVGHRQRYAQVKITKIGE